MEVPPSTYYRLDLPESTAGTSGWWWSALAEEGVEVLLQQVLRANRIGFVS